MKFRLEPMTSVGHVYAPARGALWMVFSCATFACMAAIIRHLSAELSPLEIVFFRNLFGLLVLLPWLAREGLGGVRTRKLPLYVARSIVGLTAMFAWFSALGMMPLADAVALNFTVPLFAIIASILLLHERVGIHRWSATLVGFAGTVVILRPGVTEFSLGAAFALGSAAGFALSMALIKILSRTESPATIVFYQGLIMTPLSLIPALLVWQTPSWVELAWLLGLGALATAAHLGLARAFSIAEASSIVPIDFVRLPFAAAFGYFLFGEAVDLWTWVGAAIIIASTVYIARRESLKGRRVAVAGQADDPLRPSG